VSPSRIKFYKFNLEQSKTDFLDVPRIVRLKRKKKYNKIVYLHKAKKCKIKKKKRRNVTRGSIWNNVVKKYSIVLQ